jgi:NDP-sugar pyrophosphorylase family protein
MKAMILAAGLGTRLRPLTLETAKPAIPFMGKPIIVHVIENLLKIGVQDFRINLHHLPHTIKTIFEKTPYDAFRVSFSMEEKILGTAGGLKANESFFDEDTFVMANGDILIDLDLDEALTFHRRSGGMATLILYPQPEPGKFPSIKINSQGRIVQFKHIHIADDAGYEDYLFTGIHILEREIFDFIPAGCSYEINDQAYLQAIKAGKTLYGFPAKGYWNDLGEPDRYLNSHEQFTAKFSDLRRIQLGVDTKVDSSSRLSPFVFCGSGCVLGPETVVKNSVLWDNVTLEQGASVMHCIVGSDVTIKGFHYGKILSRFGENRISGY